MVVDFFKAVLPQPWYPIVLMIVACAWIGYAANDVVADVRQHYLETSKLVNIARATCEGVRTLAKLDTEACHDRLRRGL